MQNGLLVKLFSSLQELQCFVVWVLVPPTKTQFGLLSSPLLHFSQLTLMTLMDCLISSSFLALSLIKCLSSDLFLFRLLWKGKTGFVTHWTSAQLCTTAVFACKVTALVGPRFLTHHPLLPLVVGGYSVVAFVCGLSTGLADADVVWTTVDLQEAFVFLTDLVLQVEGGLNQVMRYQRLHLGGGIIIFLSAQI